jgi:cytochrome P450
MSSADHTLNYQSPPSPARPSLGRRLAFIFRRRRDTLQFLADLARDNGDTTTFKGGRAEFWFFTHPDAVRDVLVTQDEKFIKGPALRRTKRTLGEGLLTSEGDLHRRQRRLIQPALHPQRVATYADLMTSFARESADAWHADQEIDLHAEMMRLTLRVVAKTLFDADVGADVETISHAMDISVGMFVRAMTPWGPLLNILPLPSNFRFKRAWGQLQKTIEGFISERHASGMHKDDLLSRLLEATDTEGDGTGMSDKLLRDEMITLFTAGHETTANALTFTFYLLSQHRDVEDRLHAELREVLGGRIPTAADIERLTYTRMVLAESMRLYPPAWAIGREPTEACTIAGHEVPAGAVVLLSQWVTHRDPRWWPQPEEFDPERFSPTNRSTRPRWSYFPFGGGSRLCVGESFAWMEAILIIATLAQRWRMTYLGSGPPKLKPLITLRPATSIRMRLAAV